MLTYRFILFLEDTMKEKIVTDIILCLFISGCAIAPLSNSFTGRSIGKKKVQLEGGAVALGTGMPAFKFTYGLLHDFDLGLQYDSFSFGLFSKYSLINPENKGFALAGLFGGGVTIEGNYLYVGPALSYKTGMFEPYFVTRFNYVVYDENDSFSNINIAAGEYSYFQITGGSIFWISKNFGLNVEASTFSTEATGSTEIAGPLLFGGLKIRF